MPKAQLFDACSFPQLNQDEYLGNNVPAFTEIHCSQQCVRESIKQTSESAL